MAKRTRQQAGKYSKSKGNNSERAVAKLLQAWWDVPGVTMVRVPASGGWAQLNTRNNFKAVGDIMCNDPNFPFCVENKQNESWELNQLLTTDKGPINKFWKQAVEETPAGLVPLLIIGRNRTERLVIVDTIYLYCALRDERNDRLPPSHFMTNINDQEVSIVSLKNFLTLSPDLFGRKKQNEGTETADPGPATS